MEGVGGPVYVELVDVLLTDVVIEELVDVVAGTLDEVEAGTLDELLEVVAPHE